MYRPCELIRIPAVHGVVCWCLIDLANGVWDEFALLISKRTLSLELRALGYAKLSARPDAPKAATLLHRRRDGLHFASTL